jgi:hypothetical protein
LVFEICKDLQIEYKTLKYCILGDDVVIGNKLVAEEYIRRIISLGVEISESKTHVSEHFSEFAKRLAYKDFEITPFPISALKESSKRYYLLVSLLLQENRKGWIQKDGIPHSIDMFYTHVKPLRRKFRRSIIMFAEATERVILFTQGHISASEVVNHLGRKYISQWEDRTEEDSRKLIFNV